MQMCCKEKTGVVKAWLFQRLTTHEVRSFSKAPERYQISHNWLEYGPPNIGINNFSSFLQYTASEAPLHVYISSIQVVKWDTTTDFQTVAMGEALFGIWPFYLFMCRADVDGLSRKTNIQQRLPRSFAKSPPFKIFWFLISLKWRCTWEMKSFNLA